MDVKSPPSTMSSPPAKSISAAAEPPVNAVVTLAPAVNTIVLAGNVGLEKAIKKGGFKAKVPFNPGRGDASQDQTEIKSFKWLEPHHDGFRNYFKTDYSVMPEELLLERASLMGLTAQEMTCLVGGMRVLGTNHSTAKEKGIMTDKVGKPAYLEEMIDPLKKREIFAISLRK